MRFKKETFLVVVAAVLFGCSKPVQQSQSAAGPSAPKPAANTASVPEASPRPSFPNLQAELTDDRSKTTNSPIGQFDFRNFSYPLPRGWQNPDNSDITLENGRVIPVSVDTDVGMDPEVIAERKARRRIGMSYVTTKFLDATGDGQAEAVVILKVETTGSAIPQLVYIYEWKDGRPELIWNFRTGDRADGGLKDVRVEEGELVVELYGQDRFLLGETETSKITGDEEQLCCPTHFTRTTYKWNGNRFQMNSKRLTFSTADPSAAPTENMAEIANAKEKTKMQKIGSKK